MGIPFLILEHGLGAKFRDSLANIVKDIKPRLEIIGWMVSFVIFLVLTYYIVLVGWDLVYLVLSFFKGWTLNPNNYFTGNIIVGSDNLGSLTTFVLPTLMATAVIWILTWYVSHKSLNDGISRVVNILMPLLFVIMAVIVVYALTLPGMQIGISELLNPDWTILTKIDVWLAALGQTVFSLSIGQAIIVTYASYLPEKTKLIDNVVVLVIANSLFEIFTALGVFSILGFMVVKTGIPLDQIATSGTGLLFIVFPEIFNIMGDIAYIIGPLFFLCVLFAGITSIFAFIEPLSLGLSKKFGMSRKRAVTILCISGFILSLVYTTGSGNYVLVVADEFLNDFAVVLLIIIQTIIFSWLYNLEQLLPALNKYSRFKIGKAWVNIIKYILPVFLSILLVFGVIHLFEVTTTSSWIIQIILLLLVIIVPLVLTLLPSKGE